MSLEGVGWDQWGQHILEELKRMNRTIERLSADVAEVRGDVQALKVKAGVWGALGGVAVVGIPLLITMVKG